MYSKYKYKFLPTLSCLLFLFICFDMGRLGSLSTATLKTQSSFGRKKFISAYILHAMTQGSSGSRNWIRNQEGKSLTGPLPMACSAAFLYIPGPAQREHWAWPSQVNVNQENDPQPCLQANLVEALSQSRFLFPETLASSKFTRKPPRVAVVDLAHSTL